MSVYRYDLARFAPKTRLTPQGFLRAPAYFTRVGVFTYRRADGTEIRELRPEEEVFKEDSLATLRGAPVVELHPKDGMVTPNNAKLLSIGWSSEQVSRQDTLVAGEVTIMDAASINKVRNKELSEISLGYTCSVDPTPGEHPIHGRYDQIQRGIRYNHIALGPSDWGRAGAEVSIRLDSQAIAIEGDTGVSSDHISLPRVDTKDESMPVKIRIGGVEYEVSEQAAQAIASATERRDSAAAELKSALEALQGRFDAQTQELKTTKEALAEASDPKRFDAAVSDRVALEQTARLVLGPDAELPSGSRAIHEAVLRHDNKDLDLSDKSDEYVKARFDHLVETRPEPKPGAARGDHRQLVLDQADRVDADKSRQKMIQESAQAWQKPLTVHRA